MDPSPVHVPRLARRDLVVIGASAGGVEALRKVAAGLPPDLAAAVCVVLHLSPSSPSALAAILSRAGPLPCRSASDEQTLRRGEIIVAVPDHHLVIDDGRARLTVGPRENGHRPAVDVLFRTAAAERGDRVVGVVLSGTRDDGAAGLAVIRAHGGATVVQNPQEALYSGMPTSALASGVADAVAPSNLIGQTVAAIVNGETLPAGITSNNGADDPGPGMPLTSVCPECGGVLSEHATAGVPFWECHVGHRYSPDSFAAAQAANVEAALWTAVRALRDRAALLARMANQAEGRGQARSTDRFRAQAADARRQADSVLGALTQAAATTLRDVTESDREDVAETGGAG